MVIAQRGYLTPGPLADWLGELIDATGKESVARRLGVCPRRIDSMRHGAGLMKVETIDRVLVKTGGSIAQLYGELYRFPMTEGDWCGRTCSGCGSRLRTPAPLCGFCIEERS